MKQHPADGARADWHFRAEHDRGGKAGLANTALAANAGVQVPPPPSPDRRYTADFVCHEARLIVEIDGGQHDRSSQREAERRGFLQNEGYRILRFWKNEVLANLDGAHQTIAGELGRITPTHPRATRR